VLIFWFEGRGLGYVWEVRLDFVLIFWLEVKGLDLVE
jgi:hypothetical protein